MLYFYPANSWNSLISVVWTLLLWLWEKCPLKNFVTECSKLSPSQNWRAHQNTECTVVKFGEKKLENENYSEKLVTLQPDWITNLKMLFSFQWKESWINQVKQILYCIFSFNNYWYNNYDIILIFNRTILSIQANNFF